MPAIKAELSTAELAKLMGKSSREVRRRAALEGWPTQPRQAQGGGRIYPYEDLPWDVQQLILAQRYALDPRYSNHPEMPLEDREAIHQRFLAAKDSARAVALARFDVIQACHDFIALEVGRNKAGRREFAQLYNQRKAPGITVRAYQVTEHRIRCPG